MAIVMAMTVATVVADITKTATDNVPMYIAARKANITIRNPPAAARDIRTETTMAFVVDSTRKNRRPVSATSVTDPTCDVPRLLFSNVLHRCY